ncbi:MAG: hypothetical protein PUJ24_04900 [Bacteroidales bacterium]|nr:hypothetical protein [Bacteroidales bacterium]
MDESEAKLWGQFDEMWERWNSELNTPKFEEEINEILSIWNQKDALQAWQETEP